ncbi:MAG: hypothetical protein FIB04_02850 [Gammaproteobacteria bacterium]|nr:hypothetical protein [Gammaproteobacteria bacterium]
MSLFGAKCVRCGCRTAETHEGRPTCERCRRDLELKLAAVREQPIACPIDGTAMTKAIAHMLVIDRCPTCHGVWLDGGELDHLREGVARDAMVAIARGVLSSS